MVRMYGIFRCPHCSGLQGYRMGSKTSNCISCRKRVALIRVFTYGPYKDQKEMRRELWKLKSGEMENGEISLSNEMLERNLKAGKKRMGRRDREELVLEMIKDDARSIESIHISSEMKDIDIEELEDIIGRLLDRNLIYSPRNGLYRKVD